MEQQKFNKKNLVCINLSGHSESQIETFSEIYKISLTSMINMKKKGHARIWVEKAGTYLIAYTTKKNPNKLIICANFTKATSGKEDMLMSMKPEPTPKSRKRINRENKADSRKEKENQDIILDVDLILEKIFKHGIECISKEEKDFLDSQSK
jgi:hypothetical protein